MGWCRVDESGDIIQEISQMSRSFRKFVGRLMGKEHQWGCLDKSSTSRQVCEEIRILSAKDLLQGNQDADFDAVYSHFHL